MTTAHAQAFAEIRERAACGGLLIRFDAEGVLVIATPEEVAPPPADPSHPTDPSDPSPLTPVPLR